MAITVFFLSSFSLILNNDVIIEIFSAKRTHGLHSLVEVILLSAMKELFSANLAHSKVTARSQHSVYHVFSTYGAKLALLILLLLRNLDLLQLHNHALFANQILVRVPNEILSSRRHSQKRSGYRIGEI